MAGFSAPIRRLALVSICVLLLDQITKWLIVRYLPLYANITVIDHFFNITHVLNPGGAFGFFASSPPGSENSFFYFYPPGLPCLYSGFTGKQPDPIFFYPMAWP